MKNKPTLFITLAAVLSGFSAFSVQAADAAAGKAKAAVCAGCHGPEGKGMEPAAGQPTSPIIAGQKEAYLVSSIKAYKSGGRKDALMAPIAQGLSDDDIANLAAYFSSLK